MSWPTAPLSSVSQVIRGVTFKPGDVIGLEEGGAIAVFRTKNIQEDLDLDDTWGLPARFADEGRLLQAGDLLISTANSAHLVGKVCWVPQLPQPAVPGGFIGALRANNAKLDSRYLYWWARMPSVQASIRSCANQTTNIANLSIPRLMRLEIALLPLDEQRRIAAILDQADALRARRRSTVAKFDELADSLLESTLDRQTTRSSLTIGDVSEVQGGLQLTASRNRFALDAPYLRVANVHRNRLFLDEIKSIHLSEAELARTVLQVGDIMVVEGHGNRVEIGRAAVWDGSIPQCVHQNHLIRIRVHAGRYNPVFLSRYLNCRRGKRHLLSRGKTTSGLNTISISDVRSTPLPAIPLPEQEIFARQIAEIAACADRARAGLQTLDALFASLQHRAFTGQLTRSDELLLETA